MRDTPSDTITGTPDVRYSFRCCVIKENGNDVSGKTQNGSTAAPDSSLICTYDKGVKLHHSAPLP